MVIQLIFVVMLENALLDVMVIQVVQMVFINDFNMNFYLAEAAKSLNPSSISFLDK